MNDIGIIIAIVGSAFGIIAITLGATVTLFLWGRGEASSDRRDIVDLIIAIKDDIQATQLEMMSFHNRICEIQASKNEPKEKK